MKPFNIRVYGLLEHNGKILVLHEPFRGKLIYKFPGGGLEFGEGTKECLKREFLEELNINVNILSHFYTQDFFVPSSFNPEEQILLIYYKVNITTEELKQLKILNTDIAELLWIDPKNLKEKDFTLDADKIAVEQLRKEKLETKF